MTILTILDAGFVSVESLRGAGGNVFAFADGASLTGVVYGGDGDDRIEGDSAGRTYTISGRNAGAIDGLLPNGFVQIESLAGKIGNDLFRFTAGGSLSGGVGGGEGVNSIQGGDAINSFLINGRDSGVMNIARAFSQIANLIGGSSSDAFQFTNGGGAEGSIDGGGGPDAITADDASRLLHIAGVGNGSIDGVLINGFANIENLAAEPATIRSSFTPAGRCKDRWTAERATTPSSPMTPVGRSRSAAPTPAHREHPRQRFHSRREFDGRRQQQDTFQFAVGGRLSGYIDGGAGDDALRLDDASRSVNIAAANGRQHCRHSRQRLRRRRESHQRRRRRRVPLRRRLT